MLKRGHRGLPPWPPFVCARALNATKPSSATPHGTAQSDSSSGRALTVKWVSAASAPESRTAGPRPERARLAGSCLSSPSDEPIDEETHPMLRFGAVLGAGDDAFGGGVEDLGQL